MIVYRVNYTAKLCYSKRSFMANPREYSNFYGYGTALFL